MANVIERLPARGPFTVLLSAARTAAPDTKEFEAPGAVYSGLHLVIDVTAVALTPSITVTIQGVDRTSGKVYTILESVGITAVSTTVLKVAPALTVAANTVANDLLPPIFRITVSHLDADSITYSIAGQLCP